MMKDNKQFPHKHQLKITSLRANLHNSWHLVFNNYICFMRILYMRHIGSLFMMMPTFHYYNTDLFEEIISTFFRYISREFAGGGMRARLILFLFFFVNVLYTYK